MSKNIDIPEWDYGAETNARLDTIVHTPLQKDWLCDFITQEMSIDALVSYFLKYVPIEVIQGIAESIGTYDLEEEEAA